MMKTIAPPQPTNLPSDFNGAREWTFTTRSPVKELAGHTGTIRAAAARPRRHGPVGISPVANQRFAHADGTGYPTHYWQDTSWSVVIHHPDALPADQRPKLHYYRHLAALASAPGFAELEPARERFSSSGLCLTDGRTRFVYYVPKENSAVQLRRLPAKAGQRVTMSWFNPHTGETRELPAATWKANFEVIPPAWDHFAILKVELQP